MTTWKQYVVPTVGFTMVGVLSLMAVSTNIPENRRVAFSAFLIPVIFLSTALILGWVSRTHNWASLWGTGFTARTAGIYLGASFLIVAASKLLNAAILKTVYSSAIQGLRLIPFYFPGLSPVFLRSVVGSPISEEVLFRGWLLTWLQGRDLAPVKIGRLAVNAANFLTTLSFVVLHLANGLTLNLISVFFISLLLGSARLRSGGILLPVLCHALINLMGSFSFVWVR